MNGGVLQVVIRDAMALTHPCVRSGTTSRRRHHLPLQHTTRRGYDNDDGVHGNAASLKGFFNSAMRMVLKWLNRRSQRHRDTWQGSKEVRECFHVARPRMVGRPKTRQAALKASADLRQRVVLKSSVRANRTPGSVRGRSGNGPSYREGLHGQKPTERGDSLCIRNGNDPRVCGRAL